MNEKEKNSELYNAAVIEKYLQGKLTSDEMHAIEKAALDDPFLADAIEGMNKALESRSSSSLDMDIAELRQRLKQRVTHNKNKIVPIASRRNWWQVAAVFFILTFSGMMTYYYIHNNSMERKTIAQEKNTAAQPLKDSANIETPQSKLTETDSMTFRNATAKKSKTKESVSDEKNIGPVQSKTDSMKMSAGAASAKDQREYKKEEPGAVKPKKDVSDVTDDVALAKNQPEPNKKVPSPAAENEDKSPAKASRSEYFAAPDKQNSFLGKVTDEHNKPIPAASVELKGKKIAVVTDNNGNFKLNTKDPDSIVVAKVTSIGYVTELADLNSNGSPNIIILREAKNNLQEVVTTGLGTRRKNNNKQQTTQDAAPVQGWDEYNKYLEKNKKPLQDSLGLKGPVVVSFSVNKKGALSVFVIEQSLGPNYDEEAIRLIREGPAWKLLKGKKATVTVIVTY